MAARATSRPRAAELFCFDMFYIGKLTGVGKIWQVTSCDAASSYGVARILLGCRLRPPRASCPMSWCRRPGAGWLVRRVLTDRGNEFKADLLPPAPRLASTRSIKTRHAGPLASWSGSAGDSQRALAARVPAPLLYQPGGA